MRFSLRPYAPTDEDAAISLWLRAWQATFPEIDFVARMDWWRKRWRQELVPKAAVVVAECDGAMLGFVTVERDSGYLDQLVVAPEHWGSPIATKLIAQAKQLAPRGIELLVNIENARAIRFYEKRGFVHAGPDVNPVSGRPVVRMRWRP